MCSCVQQEQRPGGRRTWGYVALPPSPSRLLVLPSQSCTIILTYGVTLSNALPHKLLRKMLLMQGVA